MSPIKRRGALGRLLLAGLAGLGLASGVRPVSGEVGAARRQAPPASRQARPARHSIRRGAGS